LGFIEPTLYPFIKILRSDNCSWAGSRLTQKRVTQEVSYGSPDFHKNGRDFFSWHAV
jgi:hypothetical protein